MPNPKRETTATQSRAVCSPSTFVVQTYRLVSREMGEDADQAERCVGKAPHRARTGVAASYSSGNHTEIESTNAASVLPNL